MRVVFRCNADAHVGFGHLMRCRSLAISLKQLGHDSIMVGPDFEYATSDDDALFNNWIPCSQWTSPAADATALVKTVKACSSQSVVLDDYRVDESYQLVLRRAGLCWLQFDYGLGQPLWANIIVNANPSANSIDYQRVLQNPNSRLLLGPRYAILRPEFLNHNRRPFTSSIKQVLVTFGGGDDRGAVVFVLSTLLCCTPESIRFLVISGEYNPRNAEIQNWIQQHGDRRVTLKINPVSVAELMLSCDLAIMAGGTGTHESVCCGLPMILIAIADNQIRQAKAWESFGLAKFLGMLKSINSLSLKEAFLKVIESEEYFNQFFFGVNKICFDYEQQSLAREVSRFFLESMNSR
jgi:UDP-2,4-diacetamido-2,4,6-trideoxy-beta-L-altropyranose hydrolase